MAWRRSGDKPLSEPMMVRLPTHICVTRPQWVIVSYNKLIRQRGVRFHICWHMCEQMMPKNFECSPRPTRKNPCLTHRQDAQSWQRYEHISSSAGSGATGYNARLTRSWETLVLTTPYEGRRHQLSWCYRETDVAYSHDEIREPIWKCQITHIASLTKNSQKETGIWSALDAVVYCPVLISLASHDYSRTEIKLWWNHT